MDADTVPAISRSMANDDTDADVVAVMTVANARRVAVTSSICDNDVPTATADCISRRMPSSAEDDVCDANVATISRSTTNSAADVEDVADTVANNSRRIPISNSICDNDVAEDIVAEIGRDMLNDAIESVWAAQADAISRRTANSAALADVVAAVDVISSRSVSNPIDDRDVDTDIADAASRSISNSDDAVAAEDVTTDSISRSTSMTADDPVCADRTDAISLNIFNSDALDADVAAIFVVNSRRVAVNNSIWANDVVAAIVVVNSNTAAPIPR